MEGEAHLTTPVEASGTATGRIDFCGGVADYSGSLVLEAPTTVSTTVNVRRTYNTRDVMLSSAAFGELAVPGYLDYLAAQEGVELKRVGEWLKAADVPGWGFYVLGSIAAFYKECGWLPEAGRGLELQVISGVPAGMGVSSSASLEVATIRALIAISGKNIPDVRVAHLAQAAENHVVGAPCGLMDQLACAVSHTLHSNPERLQLSGDGRWVSRASCCLSCAVQTSAASLWLYQKVRSYNLQIHKFTKTPLFQPTCT